MRINPWKAIFVLIMICCGLAPSTANGQQSPKTSPPVQTALLTYPAMGGSEAGPAATNNETASGGSSAPAATSSESTPEPATVSAAPANISTPAIRNGVLNELLEMKERIAQLEAELKARGGADDTSDAEREVSALRTAEGGDASLSSSQAAPVSAAPAPAAQAPAPAPAPAAPAAPTWSVGPMDLSGFIDGYYSYNFNTPTTAANNQTNDLYNFNDKTDQFSLSAAKLTLNHDPDPVGAHVDLFYGRTNTLVNAPGPNSGGEANYVEQAFLSLKPPKAKGFEMDFGKFVTSAGAEVIEAKDNWNYSRSLLFSWAIPYYHFGVRTSYPTSKTETIGFQLVNGWNNVTKSNGGVTGAFTSAYVKPKYTWDLNYYVGPENANTTSGIRNLVDTTLLLTPNAKFNAYLNFDYGSNQDSPDGIATNGATDNKLNEWVGGAVAAHYQSKGKSAVAGRYEYYDDEDGFTTGTVQKLQEITTTYEYKWVEGLLMRMEYRNDWSNVDFFHKNDNPAGTQKYQSTVTVAFIAFFGPKR